MLAKRIIPCLDIKDGRVVKGINFLSLRDAGSPVEMARLYSELGADELVFLDITATVEKRKNLASLVRDISENISIPFTVGGGIKSVDDAYDVINSGADKVSINSAAVRRPSLIDELAGTFGSQCVVIAADVRRSTEHESGYEIVIDGGRRRTGIDALSWIKEAEGRGAGEILLTSMDHDGTKNGFAIDLNSRISSNIDIPLIASGGAGKMDDFYDVFTGGRADAALAASVFHFHEIDIMELKRYLKSRGIAVRI